jgi:Mlc titration factor MtfA (ptsG expression regulator)
VFRRRRDKKRAQLREQPFPSEWEHVLERDIPFYKQLPGADRDELKGHILVFLAEKNFEGCDGFQVTDAVRVTVAAFACLLLLHRDTDYYPQMKTILVYPTTFLVDVAEARDDWVVDEYEDDLAGESWDYGPVLLSWDDVVAGMSDDTDGYNVVVHEFAHQLDLENGEVDGVPRLSSKEDYRAWATAFGNAYERFVDDVDAGRRTALDEYAAEGPSEFFAVAVEAFFEIPVRLQARYADVYAALERYFRQDPARWAREAPVEPRRRKR